MKQKAISRRDFLRLGGSTACALSAYTLFSPFLSSRLVMAQSLGNASGKNLVLINLIGGCDGLMLLPYARGPIATTLQSLRPTIAPRLDSIFIAHQQPGIANKIGVHPMLSPLYPVIHANGKIIQKYGLLRDLGRSHDTCRRAMDLGISSLEPVERGFMARFADLADFQLFQYWGFADAAATNSFHTNQAVPLVLSDLDTANYAALDTTEGVDDNDFLNEMRSSLLESQVPKNEPQARYRRSVETMNEAIVRIRSDIATQSVGKNSKGDYTNSEFGRSLRDASRVLKAKANVPSLGIADKLTAIYLTQGGYDHHSNMLSPTAAESFPNLAGALATNLAVFIQDLILSGQWSKTAIVLFSEFGRTCYENGTQGKATVGVDHGWGNNTLVLGGSVRPGVIGDIPSVTELTNQSVNALIPTIDYRDIFSDVFTWLGMEPKKVFDEEGYEPTNLGLFA